jgi:hypothetical protein
LNIGGGCLALNCHESGTYCELLQSGENLIQLKGEKKSAGRNCGYTYFGPFTCKVAFPLLSVKYPLIDKLFWMSTYGTCFTEKGITVNELLQVDSAVLLRLVQAGCPHTTTLTLGQHTHFLKNKAGDVTKVKFKSYYTFNLL